jgi:glycosyltransferase involved in cell wall biosynthesis
MSAPRFSVVVPTIRRPELVVKCVDAILGGAQRDLELIVVDQSEDDRTRRALEPRVASDARVRYLHSEISGAARARNLGASHATGELLAFVDDDAIPEPGWLAAYDRAFRELEPTPGMIGGRITPMWEGSCPSWFPRELSHMIGAYDLGDAVREFPPGDFPMSGNFALPRELMERLGGFDTRLGFDVNRENPLLGGEDSHLGLKVLNAGRKVHYHPEAAVRHLVVAAKMSPRYLLRRRYWEGRTYVQLRARGDGDRRGWLRVLRDSRGKAKPSAVSGADREASTQARLVHAAALIVFGAGMAVETIAARHGPRA